MNVCMVSYSFYESDTRILQYTKALIERGDSVDVIALRAEGKPAFEVLKQVHVYRIFARKVNERTPLQYLTRVLKFMLLAAFSCGRRHLTKRYDVIHVHSVPDFLVFCALLPKILGAKIILDVHDILPEFYASKFNLPRGSKVFRLLVLCERISASFANHVIIANALWRQRVIDRSVAAEKCTAIRNYPDPEIFLPRRKRASNGKFRILYPGSLNQHQGLDIAIRAFARVAGSMPGAEFHIYGEGPEKRALITLRDSLALEERVSINGYLPVEEIATIMADADLAVVPKRVSTGFGNEAASTKIMEFMSVGVPVIVSRTRIDTHDYDESMVMFVEPENDEVLAEAILRLWQSLDVRERIIMNAYSYVQQHNWTKARLEYLCLLDSLVAGGRARIGARAHAEP